MIQYRFLLSKYFQVYSQNDDDQPMSPCELESLIRQLTNPDVGNEMHVSLIMYVLYSFILFSFYLW